MSRLIVPIILIGIAIAGFFTFTNPIYQSISTLKETTASYNEALTNSKTLETEKEKLSNKYNSIAISDLDKIQKFLPDNVDNIRLILEIEKIATPFGMVLKDVKYDTASTQTTVSPVGATTKIVNKNYGTWNLEFSTSGTYDNFVNFTKNLEKNLRIVDIVSIDFSSNTPMGSNPSLSEIYKYNFKVKTYWLKN